MVVETLAAAAVACLAPYFAKAGEAVAKKAGEGLYDKIGGLYQAIKHKFIGDAYAEGTLARVEQKPDSEGAKATLKELLQEKIQDDPSFAETVRMLVEEAKAADKGGVIASGDRAVAIGGNVSGSTIVTGDHNWAPPNKRDQ